MKLLVTLLTAAILVYGCNEFLTGSDKNPAFEITTDQQVYSFGQEVEVTFTNNSKQEIVYLACPSVLEKKIKDKWQNADGIDCTHLRIRPIGIKKGETYSIKLNWFTNGSYDEGLFRFTFGLMYQDSNESLPVEQRRSSPVTVTNK